jgi:hypothetical protein
VTGGYIVRDESLPSLNGRYVYGDFFTGTIYSQLIQGPDSRDDAETGLTLRSIDSFGEDACGHLYATQLASPAHLPFGGLFRVYEDGQGESSCPQSPPPNDYFPYAENISPGVTNGTNEGAGADALEQDQTGSAPLNTVWYTFTLATAAPVQLEACGSSLEAVIAVYTGETVGSLGRVESRDDFCGAQSRVSFEAQADVRYWVAVDGNEGATGPFALDFSCPRGCE